MQYNKQTASTQTKYTQKYLEATVFSLFRIDSVDTSIYESLRNFNIWRVSVGNRTLRTDFWVLAPTNLRAQNYLFSTTSQLNGNSEGQYLRR